MNLQSKIACAFCLLPEDYLLFRCNWKISLSFGAFNRSLIAAYLLVLNGYNNVFHLEGGLYNWFKEGLPVDSEE